ncbi:MAG: hypothetical protein R3330_16715, partial [Saprospiraceae bacterium]|nr:hypothetical protein [Saprospiraceae bacterium]
MQRSNDILLNKGFSVDHGIQGGRLVLDPGPVEVACGGQAFLWVVALTERIHCGSGVAPVNLDLHPGESALILWPRAPWSVVISGPVGAEVSVFRITLDALHRMLAVDFQAKRMEDERMDYSKLTRVVRLSPVLLQSLERLFIHSRQSLFRSI